MQLSAVNPPNQNGQKIGDRIPEAICSLTPQGGTANVALPNQPNGSLRTHSGLGGYQSLAAHSLDMSIQSPPLSSPLGTHPSAPSPALHTDSAREMEGAVSHRGKVGIWQSINLQLKVASTPPGCHQVISLEGNK